MFLYTEYMSTQQPEKASMSARLSALYGRPDTCQWTFCESSLFFELTRRPDFEAELVALESFRKVDKWFPKSLESLLNKWCATLDRSREAAFKPKVYLKSVAPPKASGNEMSDEQRKSFAEQLENLRESMNKKYE